MFYACCICEEKFTRFKCLRRHITSYHDLETVKVFQCTLDGCYRSFSGVKQYFKHIRTEHIQLEENKHEIVSVPESEDDQPDEAKMLSCSPEIMTSSQLKEECLAPNGFDCKDLKYVLKLFKLNNINRTTVYQIIQENINLAKAKGLDRPFDNLTSEHLIIKALKSLNIWNEPEEVIISYEEKLDSSKIINSPIKVPVLNLAKSLEIFFLPNQNLNWQLNI